jgi:hypothetical protein
MMAGIRGERGPMPMRNDVAEILSRFPGPVTLHPSRMKWLLVFAGGALFATGGGLMVADGKGTGWFVLIFFVLVALESDPFRLKRIQRF